MTKLDLDKDGALLLDENGVETAERNAASLWRRGKFEHTEGRTLAAAMAL